MFNENEYKILQILKENDWISGEEIAERLNISRTAVWKYIKKLVSYGYEIISIRNRGYKMSSGSKLEPVIQLKHKFSDFYKEIIYLMETKSTQEYAIKKMLEKRQNILVIADRQTKARGKRESLWISSEGGIYFSIGLGENFYFKEIHEIEKILENGISSVISAYSGRNAQIINSDILVDGKKIGGILQEHFDEADTVKFLVFGVGVYIDKFPEGLCSLKYFGDKDINRWEIAADIITSFSQKIKDMRPRGFEPPTF